MMASFLPFKAPVSSSFSKTSEARHVYNYSWLILTFRKVMWYADQITTDPKRPRTAPPSQTDSYFYNKNFPIHLNEDQHIASCQLRSDFAIE